MGNFDLTSAVYMSSLESPKSAILHRCLSPTRTFRAARSLCMKFCGGVFVTLYGGVFVTLYGVIRLISHLGIFIGSIF